MSDTKYMLNDNKQQNNLEQVNNDNTNFNVATVTVFKDNPESFYLYKKTEKLVSAIYLLSSFITDKEPVKWQLREASMNLLSQSLNLSDRTSSKQITIHFDFVSVGLKLLSFLEVSYISGIISEMNYNILKFEFESLIKTVESGARGTASQGLIFPDHFFEVSSVGNDQIVNSILKKNISTSVGISSKGQSVMSDRMSLKKPVETVRPSELKQKDKSNRQDIIISLLKKGGELGIKDFTTAIKGCSEKTIQRELVTLVSKGQIKKAGEKRWSRYSLK